MQVNPINNKQPNFGIKYANKSAWNPEVLKTFESSNLLKGIDKKFPKASVVYSKIFEEDAFGFDSLHTLVADFKLAENKLFRWMLSSHSEEVPEEEFMEFIKEASLTDIENKAVCEPTPLETLKIKKVSKLRVFFDKIFKKQNKI